MEGTAIEVDIRIKVVVYRFVLVNVEGGREENPILVVI